ncbi:MAG: hypothetical protein ACE14M_06365 [Terriglobales bacterium]
MTFHSILFPRAPDRIPDEQLTQPDFFGDLNLDQIVAAMATGKEEYKLKPFFYMSLDDLDAITFRQEIMKDLEVNSLFENIKAFAQSLHTMREHLAWAEKLTYKLQKERWFLDAVNIYCDAIARLTHDLSLAEVSSRGFRAFREYVTQYAASERFTSLVEQAKKLTADLAAIRYTVLIDGLRVQVDHYHDQTDYSAEVEATFEKFKQHAVEDHTFKFSNTLEMNHVEGEILALVARLHPEVFSALETFSIAKKEYQDPTLVRFDREIQFYIAYLEHIARFKKKGLNFCYPKIVRDCKEVYDYAGFDLALAGKLISERAAEKGAHSGSLGIVCNDFHLKGRERMIVVSGPNQGGKTTFARTFGQLHYLAALGCPVPGTRAQLFLFDQLFTHFEKEEDINNLRGKLQDDLIRVHQIIESATRNSIVILNEIFTSTTVQDALLLSKKIAEKLIARGLLCVWVTFIDELASLGDQTVSMVSTVVPENPALRTYKILRQRADGLAYAMAIAEKHRVTYAAIKERIGS